MVLTFTRLVYDAYFCALDLVYGAYFYALDLIYGAYFCTLGIFKHTAKRLAY